MNKDNRIYRTLAAAKRAFFEEPKAEPEEKAPSTDIKDIQKEEAKADAKPVSLPTVTAEPVTVEDLKTEKCTGCGACCAVCPKGAIEMKRDSEGFLSPVIDHSKCIKCKICAKTCPAMNDRTDENTKTPECFAVKADDDIRMKSSSGGVFSLLADYVFGKGGVVCGAAFTDDFHVEHIIIDDPSQMYRLRGSKYVQSNTAPVFAELKKLLDEGRYVLFSGCPCQVAGLKAFLKKDHENLLTMDIVCHGVPSPGAFEKYLEETCDVSQIKEFRFRTKSAGYNCVNLEIVDKEDNTQLRCIETDPYEKCFHGSVMLRQSCYSCKFCELPRRGDITAGDFWGISQFDTTINDDKGVSVMLINNEKGNAVVQDIMPAAQSAVPVPLEYALRNNRFGARVGVNVNKRRNFFEVMPRHGFVKAANYAANDRYDIGLIGLWYGRNYGSMATYYALHQVLQKTFGLSVLMIENPLEREGADIKKTDPRKIARDFYKVSKKYRIDDLGSLNSNCDTFMVGSDQLWNIYLSRPYRQMYYLSFAGVHNKRIAYGTSFGKGFGGTEKEKTVNSYFLRQFDHVSVRDKLSKDIAENMFGVSDVVQVCDPTFLCPLEEYQALIDKAELEYNEEYILAYVLDPDEIIGKQLEKISVEKKCKVIVILDEPPQIFEENIAKLALTPKEEMTDDNKPDIEIKSEVDLYEWLWYYSHAKAVVTDSFHGTIFSIIYQKPFITLLNKKRGAQRFVSLLEPVGLKDRLFDTPQQLGENMGLLDGLDYTEPDKKLDELRSKSMSWLENALFSPKKYDSYCAYAAYDKRMEDKK